MTPESTFILVEGGKVVCLGFRGLYFEKIEIYVINTALIYLALRYDPKNVVRLWLIVIFKNRRNNPI